MIAIEYIAVSVKRWKRNDRSEFIYEDIIIFYRWLWDWSQ